MLSNTLDTKSSYLPQDFEGFQQGFIHSPHSFCLQFIHQLLKVLVRSEKHAADMRCGQEEGRILRAGDRRVTQGQRNTVFHGIRLLKMAGQSAAMADADAKVNMLLQ